MEIYHFYKHFEEHYPEHLKGLERPDIGYGGTVVMNVQGQYKHTHSRMVEAQLKHDKDLILDFCFTLN